MRYKVVHTTTYSYSESVPVCHNQVHLTPRDTARQTCLTHRLSIRPAPTSVERAVDYFGNQVHYFNVQEAHQKMVVAAISKVRVRGLAPPSPEATSPWELVRDWTRGRESHLRLDSYQFTFDSPQVSAAANLLDYALPSFPAGRPILAALLDLVARIHRDFAYDPLATTVSTPLDEVLRLRRGVCQDFAHLAIGCLRSLGLSARYVSGYLLTVPPQGQPRLVGADASHAWFSTYCPEIGWIDLDPTNNCIPSAQHITLAWGRDYGDVCPIKGVFVGGGQHGMSVAVDVLPLDEEPEPDAPR